MQTRASASRCQQPQARRLKFNLHQLLTAMIEKGASDLHITTGSPPLLRIDGALVPLKLPPLTPVDTKQLCYSILTEEQKIKFEKNERARPLLRREEPVALPRQHLHAARRRRRRVPHHPVQDPLASTSSGCRRSSPSIANKPRGLVLVTGPTGSGKSTTLASIIDKINSEQRAPHHDDRGSDRVPAPAQDVRS